MKYFRAIAYTSMFSLELLFTPIINRYIYEGITITELESILLGTFTFCLFFGQFFIGGVFWVSALRNVEINEILK